MGSGTTAVAALQEGRHYVGFELNKDYYDKAVKRICEERKADDFINLNKKQHD